MKLKGITKGDRVCIYMPMIPEATVAMLACTRIGAIHSVVFSAFSDEALAGRIKDAQCTAVITADVSKRVGKVLPLKEKVDQALLQCPSVNTTFVVKTSDAEIAYHDWDVDYHEAIAEWSDNPYCEAESMDAEDPLFILYTSGSTGKPKGVQHTTGGYITYAAMTHKYAFDYHDGDIYWCTADIGWITGHSYIVYGPLANGATTLMFEGVPTYPTYSRFWEIIDKHKVNIFYTAPTVLRSLMGEGDDYVTKTSRKSLRVLGTVGEPINEDAWNWYHDVVGDNRCPIVDTWWQTETGGILVAPLPGAVEAKPGKAMTPFFGIQPVLVDDNGNEFIGSSPTKIDESGKEVEESLRFAMKSSWPGMMRTLYGDHERFLTTYFAEIPGMYFTGDGATRDKNGFYRITGRMDDVLNVSGHRLGTAELESALGKHPNVAETAVVGIPDTIKGEVPYAYVTLKAGVDESSALEKSLVQLVRREIGPIATIDTIHFTKELPKTRSGKIMRRILRKVANGDYDGFGDTSTLTDPSVVETLVGKHQSMNTQLGA
jgi:acetyl-CoA synthetase